MNDDLLTFFVQCLAIILLLLLLLNRYENVILNGKILYGENRRDCVRHKYNDRHHLAFATFCRHLNLVVIEIIFGCQELCIYERVGLSSTSRRERQSLLHMMFTSFHTKCLTFSQQKKTDSFSNRWVS